MTPKRVMSTWVISPSTVPDHRPLRPNSLETSRHLPDDHTRSGWCIMLETTHLYSTKSLCKCMHRDSVSARILVPEKQQTPAQLHHQEQPFQRPTPRRLHVNCTLPARLVRHTQAHTQRDTLSAESTFPFVHACTRPSWRS